MTTSEEKLAPRPAPAARPANGLPVWVSGLLPLVLLAALLAVFAFGNPLALFRSNLPAVEDLAIQPVRVTDTGFEFDVINTGPSPVTIAQLMVDAAFWHFSVTPSATLGRLGRATIHVTYPWVLAEPNELVVMTSTGATFTGEVAVATPTPRPGLREFVAYGLLGVYVGILPVGLGLLWFPAMRKLGRRGLGAILAFTIGLLIFLLVDTLLEAIEVSGQLAGVFQGVPLALFAALITWLALMAISARSNRQGATPAQQRLYVATLIALGIGLHNLGEGLAIGTAFALGEAALGSFLVIGFTLHNVTEGVGIAAPVTRDQPALKQFIGLGLLAGAPAILGAWIGGFTSSPVLAVLFLGIGTGAIWQVIVEVGNLLRRDAERDGLPVVSWLNVGALVAGIAVMYLTAFLVH
jgi:zinc transporter, ZIP family